MPNIVPVQQSVNAEITFIPSLEQLPLDNRPPDISPLVWERILAMPDIRVVRIAGDVNSHAVWNKGARRLWLFLGNDADDHGLEAVLKRTRRAPLFIFDGDLLEVIVPDGEEPTRDNVCIVIRRVCEVLGVSFTGQCEKLKSAPWAGVKEILTPSAGGPQRVSTIPLKALPMWLARLNPGKVRPELRAKIIRYQCEAADALADHFLGKRDEEPDASDEGVAISPTPSLPPADWRALRERRLNAKLLAEMARDTPDADESRQIRHEARRLLTA